MSVMAFIVIVEVVSTKAESALRTQHLAHGEESVAIGVCTSTQGLQTRPSGNDLIRCRQMLDEQARRVQKKLMKAVMVYKGSLPAWSLFAML